jgi:hypothetical protein
MEGSKNLPMEVDGEKQVIDVNDTFYDLKIWIAKNKKKIRKNLPVSRAVSRKKWNHITITVKYVSALQPWSAGTALFRYSISFKLNIQGLQCKRPMMQ